jgi:hypothetical protein
MFVAIGAVVRPFGGWWLLLAGCLVVLTFAVWRFVRSAPSGQLGDRWLDFSRRCAVAWSSAAAVKLGLEDEARLRVLVMIVGGAPWIPIGAAYAVRAIRRRLKEAPGRS